MMTHNNWRDSNLYKVIDVDKKYGGQCVDAARDHMAKVDDVFDVEGVNGAVDFFTKYDHMPKLKAAYHRIMYQPGMVAPQGAKIIWGTTPNNSFGHIAICDSATQLTLTILEQDGFDNPARKVDLGDTDGLEMRVTSYDRVLGWLIPRELPEPVRVIGNLPPDGARIAKSDRTAQNGDHWLNQSVKPARWMLLANGKWDYI